MNIIMDNCDAEVWPDELPPPRDMIMKQVDGVDGILSLITDYIDGDVMDAAGAGLKIISNYAVGYDNIDVTAATERGILVANTPGTVTESTADLAFTLLLAAARRIGEGIDHVRTGKWKTFKPLELLGKDIHHATLGIIGLGRIGMEVARRARGFDMEILYYDHRMRPEKGAQAGAVMCATMEELLARSDFVSLHVPLNDRTRHLISRTTLAQMKTTAVLINTTRGPVVDTDALYDALVSRQIAYAALDVTDPEPLPKDHKLMTVPNCLVVPHIGSATIETRNRMAVMAAENLVEGAIGRTPKQSVNPDIPARRR
jgi:lactate dehydrogenase-like 2-hydroxyacid dehydrogenase